MKQYPFDRMIPFILWPMDAVQGTTSIALRVLVMTLGTVWAIAAMLLSFPVLAVSVAMQLFDSLSEPR